MTTAGELLRLGRQHLQGKSASVALDVRLLLCHALDIDELALFREPEKPVTEAQQNVFLALLRRRLEGQPIAYLLGHRAFYDADFKVTQDTLIPRPDTELLVERMLALLPADNPLEVADLGTGSGIIAITLARLRPAWRLLAVDSSAAALGVARTNALAQQVSNVHFRQGNWLQAIDKPLDAIACNPPYIADDDHHLACGDVRFEPRSALVAAEEGLADIRQVATEAKEHLKPGGWLAFEHGFEQAPKVRRLLATAGFVDINSHRDLAGHERTTEGRKPC